MSVDPQSTGGRSRARELDVATDLPSPSGDGQAARAPEDRPPGAHDAVPSGAGRPTCPLCDDPHDDDPWLLVYEGADPAVEGSREAVLTLANGYLGTRGADAESVADGVHYPGTYVAGLYNRLTSVVEGEAREDESRVNLPNWLPLSFRAAGGPWLGEAGVTVRHQHRALDLRRGILQRELLVEDGDGRRTRLSERRLVSMADPHLAALEARISPENWRGRVDVRAGLDAEVRNGNVAEYQGLADRHLRAVDSAASDEGDGLAWVAAETVQSGIRVTVASRLRAAQADERAAVATPGAITARNDDPGRPGHELTVELRAGSVLVVEKVAAVYTSRDPAIADPQTAALAELRHAGAFDELAARHATAWELLWRTFHLGLEEGAPTRRAANIYIFHLLQSLSPHTADLDVGVTARGLHGEGYQGHVFWDALFVFPFLNLRLPTVSRSLLLYRYRRLPQARRNAAALGLPGARFAWQSGSDGREETPPAFRNPLSGRWVPDNSWRQFHVSLAVAYDLWQYWEVTRDLVFLSRAGAELLVETARFWAALAHHDAADDRYDIRGVMGPDEFHDGYPNRPGGGIDNNAYVNVMTAWVLIRARDACDLLGGEVRAELYERLGVTAEELDRWDHLSRRLRVPFLDNGLLAQFEGYDDLAEIDLDEYRRRHDDIARMDEVLEAEGDSPNRYQISKQADVLMLFYLFSAEELTSLLDRLDYKFDPVTIPATVDHYLARTSHGSSLSRVVHAWVLARTNRSRSWALLQEALRTDLSDRPGSTTREGIHLGAQAGCLDLLQRGYTGLDIRDDVVHLNPCLPEDLRSLELTVQYQGQWLTITVERERLQVRAAEGPRPTLTLDVRGARVELAPGDSVTVPLTHPLPPAEERLAEGAARHDADMAATPVPADADTDTGTDAGTG